MVWGRIVRPGAVAVAAVAFVVGPSVLAHGAGGECDPVLRCVTAAPPGATLVATQSGGGLDAYVSTTTTGNLQLVGLDGSVRWSLSAPSPVAALPRLVAAGDFTGDDVTDYVFWVLRDVEPQSPCGGTDLQTSTLLFVDGADGAISEPAPALQDICWQLNFNYPTHQWEFGTVYIGDFTPAIAGNEVVLTPYYATEGTVLADVPPAGWRPVTGRDGRTAFVYPSVPAFDSEYGAVNSRPCSSIVRGGACYIQYSHVANGVFVRSATGGDRFFVLTSNRAVLYRPDLTPTGDTTWLPGGTTANGGRNYGLVQTYSSDGQTYIDLVGGCTVEYTRRAMLTGAPDGGDPLCGIVRHVERFQVRGDSITRFGGVYYSYAIDAPMHGRVEFPAHAHAPIVRRGTIWTLYDVYDGVRWATQVLTSSRQTKPALTLSNWFLWDAADVDGDGRAELLATRIPGGGTIPSRQFDILRWANGRFRSIRHVDGYVPALVRLANSPSRHTDDSNIFSSMTVDLDHSGHAEILVEDARGARSWLDWRSR